MTKQSIVVTATVVGISAIFAVALLWPHLIMQAWFS
jgi:hypothetical protein